VLVVVLWVPTLWVLHMGELGDEHPELRR